MTDMLATTEYVQGILGSTGSATPELVERLTGVCSEQIMKHCDRRFLPLATSPSVRTFRARSGATAISLVPWDFQATGFITVVVDPTGANKTLVVEDDFWVEPANDPWGMADRIMLQRPLNGSKASIAVRVTALWGWPVIPPTVQEACALWVRDILRAVSAYPQDAQLEAGTALASDGVVPYRYMLSSFKHMVAA